MNSLPLESAVGFKEWAAICEALAAGRQAILLRKGGIDEGRAGFRVLHDNFWLYPTKFHQAAESLTTEGAEFVAKAAQARPPSGQIALRLFAAVEEVHELSSESVVEKLAEFHLWSRETVHQRFHYRRPGLFLLVTRIFTRPEPIPLDESADMAGCKSWAALPRPLTTAGLRPVLADNDFARRVAAIHAALA